MLPPPLLPLNKRKVGIDTSYFHRLSYYLEKRKEPNRDHLVSNLPRAFVSKANLFSIRALFITSSVKILNTGVVFLSLQVYM